MDGSNLTYIIGDVHGCYLTLLELVKKIPKGAKIVFVGDLIDRGPRSNEVIEFVKSNGYDCVLGNHEKMMIDSFSVDNKDWSGPDFWILNGGDTTKDSYNGDDELLKEHVDWLNKLPLYIEFKDIVDDKGRYLVVSHSTLSDYFNGYKNLLALSNMPFSVEEETPDTIRKFKQLMGDRINCEEAMIWGRSVPITKGNKFFNVFGHTPIDYMKEKFYVDNLHHENIVLSEEIGFADVDTGCVYNKEGRNELTALEFPSLKVIRQENIDMPKRN